MKERLYKLGALGLVITGCTNGVEQTIPNVPEPPLQPTTQAQRPQIATEEASIIYPNTQKPFEPTATAIIITNIILDNQ